MKWKWMLLSMVLGVANAQGSERPRFYIQGESWSTNGAYEEDRQAFNTIPGAWKFITKPGYGARAGVWVNAMKGLDLGVSLGEVWGPSREAQIFIGSGYGAVSIEARTRFDRFLAHVQGRARLAEGIEFRLAAGVGVAQGHIQDNYRFRGIPASVPQINEDWTGITWEVSPALAFGPNGQLELGFVFGGFPKLARGLEFNEFHWQPTGIRLAFNF